MNSKTLNGKRRRLSIILAGAMAVFVIVFQNCSEFELNKVESALVTGANGDQNNAGAKESTSIADDRVGLTANSLSGQSAAEPAPVQDWDKQQVGVYYFANFSPNSYPTENPAAIPWWKGVKEFFSKTGTAYSYWMNRTPWMQTSHLQPLIGYYNQTDPKVLEKHIDQAYLGGVDYFNFYWYWSASKGRPHHVDGLTSYFSATNISKMKFMVSIYSHPWDEDLFISAGDAPLVVLEMFKLFAHPSYLRIGNRPVLTIGDGRGIKNGFVSDMQDMISILKQHAVSRGLPQPIILVGVASVKETTTSNWSHIANRDGYQCLVPDVGGNLKGQSYDDMVNRTTGFLNNVNTYAPLSPCVASNFDERPRQDVMNPDPESIRYFAGQTADKFAQAMKNVRAWQKTKSNPIHSLMNLYAWNEWHEGGIIEPNFSQKFLYLEKIQLAYKTIPLRRYNTGTHRVTTLKLSGGVLEGGWLIFNESRTGQNRRSLYECRSGANKYFVSLDKNCEGNTTIGLLGYIGATAQSYPGGNGNLLPLFRCNNGNSHFVSSDSKCEGARTEGLLGYAFFGSAADLQ